MSFLFASPENSKIRMAIGNFPDRVANFGAHRISLSTKSLMCHLQDIALRFLQLNRHVMPICIQLPSKLISSFHSLCFGIFELNENVLDIKRQNVAIISIMIIKNTFGMGKTSFFFSVYAYSVGHLLLLPYYAISRE